jgi:hypothetical protein
MVLDLNVMLIPQSDAKVRKRTVEYDCSESVKLVASCYLNALLDSVLLVLLSTQLARRTNESQYVVQISRFHFL